MAEGRKQAISLRLSAADIRRIKKLAQRLGTRDSDVVRFAIKMMLHRMLPLTDSAIRGRGLVPGLADWGPEVVRHFELDVAKLDEIVNGEIEGEERVATEDLALLAMASTQESYAKLSIRTLAPPSRQRVESERRDGSATNTMRRLLYDKYVYGPAAGSSARRADEVPAPGAAPAERARRKGNG